MTTLYIANKNYSSWSLRPWVLMKHLGLPFDEQLMVFGEGSNWDAFRRFSPNGRVPCLRDGDTVVWDSLAIAEYLAESHAGVWPSDRVARAWARCASAEMHSGFGTLRNECGMSCGVRVRLHGISAALQADIARINELWNEGLSRFGGPFLAGKTFTAVDAFYAPVVFRFQTYGLPADGAVVAYVQRMLALPAMREWYTAALAEPWRDHAHEAETHRYGEVTEDFRLA
ncbi:glutathione S-transferase family protein [Dyella terrae]|uniref:glutathione S-transferase family protein n=1 Tax=Dyella terrae TaxID=522259 RepID=UPI001EFE842F|nr:glutathione S-transferase family protein [Dyella terrae]ULU25888.1 glutathione S-transferase family protein [Dyella terrae]